MPVQGTTRSRCLRVGAVVLGFVLARTVETTRLSDAAVSASGGNGPSPCATTVPLPWSPPEDAGKGLRVVTYNIHSGLGDSMSLWRPRAAVEGNLREIASDIAASAGGDPIDVVALNEVDFGSRRSGWIDEAEFLAAELHLRSGENYSVVRGETWQRSAIGREVRFGNAVLVRLPVTASGACRFGDVSCPIAAEPDGLAPAGVRGLRAMVSEERGVVKVRVMSGSRAIDIVATHLDAFSAEVRERQAMHLLHRFVDPARTTVLLGDLNAVATAQTGSRRFFREDRTLDILTSASLSDVRERFPADDAGWATYPAANPLWPLDGVLATVDLAPVEIAVVGKRASDHRGLMVRLALVDDASMLARERARHERVRRAQAERIRSCDFATEETRVRRGWLIEETGFASLAALF
jgi:endonuclease/exonuclease/phosphatase family metal-dependent hydrolase